MAKTAKTKTAKTKTATAMVAPSEIPSSCRTDILSAKGRKTGERIQFGSGTIPALRKMWKAKGLSNSKVSLKLRETLQDEAQLRWALHGLAMEEVRAAGKIPTVCDIRSQSAVVRFSDPPKAPKAPKGPSPEVQALQAEIERLKALVGEKSPVTLDV